MFDEVKAAGAEAEDVELPKGVRKIDCSLAATLKRHHMKGPFCHVGALINRKEVADETVAWWREQFQAVDRAEFVGIDLFSGPNVDVVADLCDPEFGDRHPELIGRFNTVFCFALLEHVKNPFEAARTINALIAPGGHLYFGGPWSWGYHAYPKDYFRISFDGLEVLFPELEWRQRWYMSTKRDVGLEFDHRREKKLLRIHKVEGLASVITDIGIPYLNLGAVGRKPVDEPRA